MTQQPVEIHALTKGKHRNQVILGYGNLLPADIEIGIARLETALSGSSPERGTSVCSNPRLG